MSKSTKATKSARKPRITVGVGAANFDRIATVLTAKGGAHIVVTDCAGNSLIRPSRGDSKEFRSYAAKGASFSALTKWVNANPIPKPQARLANGVDVRSAPHSAKAVRDQKAKPAANKGKARTAKAAANKQPSRGADRAYTLGKRKDESKPDTFRRYMLTTIMKHSSTASAKAAHAKSNKYPTHKLDFNWASQQGYIVLGK